MTKIKAFQLEPRNYSCFRIMINCVMRIKIIFAQEGNKKKVRPILFNSCFRKVPFFPCPLTKQETYRTAIYCQFVFKRRTCLYK